jgi:hypothetical protein
MPRKKVAVPEKAPRRRSIDPRTDPLGYFEQVLVPTASIRLFEIIKTRVPRDHRQWVRSLTIQRAASATIINGYVALKSLGIQSQNREVLGEILMKLKKHDESERMLTRNQRDYLDKLTHTEIKPLPLIEAEAEREEVEAETAD